MGLIEPSKNSFGNLVMILLVNLAKNSPVSTITGNEQKMRFKLAHSHNRNKSPAVLEFPTAHKYSYASFFSRTQTRSLPPWAAVDPIRRLNNP